MESIIPTVFILKGVTANSIVEDAEPNDFVIVRYSDGQWVHIIKDDEGKGMLYNQHPKLSVQKAEMMCKIYTLNIAHFF